MELVAYKGKAALGGVPTNMNFCSTAKAGLSRCLLLWKQGDRLSGLAFGKVGGHFRLSSQLDYRRHTLSSKQNRVGLQRRTCRASQALALEKPPVTRLDVDKFLRDSIPSEVWFGGFSFGPRDSETWNSKTSIFLKAQDFNVREQQGDKSQSGSSPSTWTEAAECPPTVSALSLVAAALLVLGPVRMLAMVPFNQPASGLLLPSQNYFSANQIELRDFSSTSQTSPFSQILATSRSESSPAPNPLGPRLPVIVYDPDELLKEPLKEKESKNSSVVKSPADLAESLQKGCGGPECLAPLFRPSAEIETMGIAGALIFGLISERRRRVVGELQSLVDVSENQKQESEALVASLQQELEKQRSLLSKILQQSDVPISEAHVSTERLPARPPKKAPIGSRDWMEGIGRRGLEALSGRKGKEASTSGSSLDDHAYFTKMGQVHGYDVSKAQSNVSSVLERTILGEPLDKRQVAHSEEDTSARDGGTASTSGKDASLHAMRYVVPDTNQFLRNLPMIKRLREKKGLQTVVPLAVLNELDGLQNARDKRAEVNARKALRYLAQEMSAGMTWLRGQRRSEVRCLVGSDEAVPVGESTPQAAWRQTSYQKQGALSGVDEALLDCCVHFSGGGSEVTLLTDDKTLQLKAMFHSVKSTPIEDFLVSLESSEAVALPTRIDTEVAIDQLRRYEIKSANGGDALKRPKTLVGRVYYDPSRNPDKATASVSQEAQSSAISAVRKSSFRIGSAGRLEMPRETRAGRHIGVIQEGEASTSSNEARQTRGARAKTGKGRNTTLGRKKEELAEDKGPEADGRETQGGLRADKTQGRRPRFVRTKDSKEEGSSEDSGPEADGSRTGRGSRRDRTQNRRPRFARTKSGKAEERGAGISDLADRLKEEGDRTTSSRGRSRDREKRPRQPP